MKIGLSSLAKQMFWFFRELIYLILFLYPSYRVSTVSSASFPFYIDRCSMSGHRERRVKVRHEITQSYERRRLSRGDMTIDDDLDPNDNSSSDENVKDETYVPSPQAHPHGKRLASVSGIRATRDEEIEKEDGGADGEEEKEIFDVEEINPPNCINMRPPTFRAPSNPIWRMRVSYKGKTESVRKNRRILTRIQPRDAYNYIFHSLF
jgi:hypothetical protein